MTKQLQAELIKLGLKYLLAEMNRKRESKKKGVKWSKKRHKKFAETMAKKWSKKRESIR